MSGNTDAGIQAAYEAIAKATGLEVVWNPIYAGYDRATKSVRNTIEKQLLIDWCVPLNSGGFLS